MPTLTEIHLDLQERLRVAVAAAVGAVWDGLPGYDDANVDEWLSTVLPIVLAGQERAVALADAYIARALERPALGINPEELVGANVRNGAAPEDVYRRPFVEMWAALGAGKLYADAFRMGRDRATSTAATDTQLSHLRSYNAIGERDDRIVGYQRVPNASACSFCRLIATRRYHKSALQPVHPYCGCGVEPITVSNRDQFFGKRENDVFHDDPLPEGVAVHEHGELGPVLAAPGHHFQGPDF